MLEEIKKRQEKAVLISQVISFCLLAIVILVVISFKTKIAYEDGYFHAAVMFLVIFPLIILVRFLSIKYLSVYVDYSINIFYYVISGIFLISAPNRSFEIILLMPIIIMALKYGRRHALLTAFGSICVLFYVSYYQAFSSIDSDLMYFIGFILLAWLLGTMRDTQMEIQRSLERLARRDGLTDLYNHRAFQMIMDRELQRVTEHKELLSVILLDIDYFKTYNDSYGHQKGDFVLQCIAGIIKDCTPQTGYAARYGGEEFALILPGMNTGAAKDVGEEIRKKVEEEDIPGKSVLPQGKLTISVGIAEYPLMANTKEKLIQKADEALYKAKFVSKNKVVAYYSVFDELSMGLSGEEKDIFNSIRTLTMVINAKDRYTYGHSERAMQLVQRMGEREQLDETLIRDLIYSALLHDIGKIEIEREVLNKRAKLNAEEWAILKNHPQWGADIIRPLKSLENVIDIVLYHHENYDGSGYPHGLKGEHIPIGARILRIIDSYDAMTSNRPYREGMTKAQALEELASYSGKHYDPFYLNLFIRTIVD